jgi:O-acetylhomoserine/O-acetylserine sulfhydrylase-like pyridoxal-dependent enzyme
MNRELSRHPLQLAGLSTTELHSFAQNSRARSSENRSSGGENCHQTKRRISAIGNGLIRISIGIEDTGEIIEDLALSLEPLGGV